MGMELTYDDLCKRCSSILQNVGSNNKVFVCHIVETQTEELILNEEVKDDKNDTWMDWESDEDDEDDEDDDNAPERTIEIKSTFDCLIKYDFEICFIHSLTMSVQEIMIKIKQKTKWTQEDDK